MTTSILICIVIATMCWWHIEEQILRRNRIAHLVNAGATALFAGLYFLLPKPREEARLGCFVAACVMGSRWVFVLLLQLAEQWHLRRYAAQLAALPIRHELCTASTQDCALSFDSLCSRLQPYRNPSTPGTEQSFTGAYESQGIQLDIWCMPLHSGGWLLALWDCGCNAEFYDKELAYILDINATRITPDDIPMGVSSLAICKAGHLHIYPASCAHTIQEIIS